MQKDAYLSFITYAKAFNLFAATKTFEKNVSFSDDFF